LPGIYFDTGRQEIYTEFTSISGKICSLWGWKWIELVRDHV